MWCLLPSLPWLLSRMGCTCWLQRFWYWWCHPTNCSSYSTRFSTYIPTDFFHLPQVLYVGITLVYYRKRVLFVLHYCQAFSTYPHGQTLHPRNWSCQPSMDGKVYSTQNHPMAHVPTIIWIPHSTHSWQAKHHCGLVLQVISFLHPFSTSMPIDSNHFSFV